MSNISCAGCQASFKLNRFKLRHYPGQPVVSQFESISQVPVENVPEPLPVYESIRSASTPVNEEEPRFFTADEMASVTGVSERTVRDIHTAEKGIGMCSCPVACWT